MRRRVVIFAGLAAAGVKKLHFEKYGDDRSLKKNVTHLICVYVYK